MRIVHVTDLFSPAVGGTERHVEQLAAAQQARGHDVSVLTFRGPDTPARETLSTGVTVERVTPWSAVARRAGARTDELRHPTVADPGFVRAIRAAVHIPGQPAAEPVVVHAHNWAGLSAARATRRGDAALVWSFHDYAATCARRTLQRPSGAACAGPELRACVGCASEHYGVVRGPVAALGLRASRGHVRHAEHLVANSGAVAHSIRAVIPDARVHVVPPWIAPPTSPDGPFDGVPATANGPSRDGGIVFVGARAPHKGVDVLRDAYARARAELTRRGEPAPPLVLMGPGHDGQPAAGVTELGPAPHAVVLATLARAQIAVVPSVWAEPFGLVAVEAMAMGAPVVASDVGGLAEIIDASTGVFVPPGDAGALADALVALLTDGARAARLGAAGPARAATFDAVGPLERIYEDALAH